MAHAVVIGGSLAGLLAARVLSDHADQVTVLERDQMPDQPGYRAGVPQARHLHVLLAKGRDILTQYFPTLEADFQQLGIPNIEIGWQTAAYTAGGWTKRTHSGVFSNPVSRTTIDWYVYQQLLKRPNITFRTQMDVERLLIDSSGKVTGVEATSRADQSTQTVQANLVVDASGRQSKAPEWLQALGYEAPPRTVVNAYLGYATRWYEIPADRSYDWQIMLVTTLPKEGILRGGGIQVVEGNQWVVTLVGVNKVYPPNDDDGFLEFARQLPSPLLFETIRDAKPVSPVYGYRRTENIWNHYEQLPRTPAAFTVIGDAFCGFNPIYGQGMSVAAMEAQALDVLLRQTGVAHFEPAAFYRALAKIIENPWLLATGEDLRYPGTEGNRPGKLARLAQIYVEHVIAALPLDEEVARLFVRVNNLLDPPQVLFRPTIVARVLRLTLRGGQRDEQLNAPVVRLKSVATD